VPQRIYRYTRRTESDLPAHAGIEHPRGYDFASSIWRDADEDGLTAAALPVLYLYVAPTQRVPPVVQSRTKTDMGRMKRGL